ncbi:alpha/beta fold hydrolase [Mycolicibacterium pyrenivorans]|uniref:alpha/beta fold hydrolase n=1 Tax=Mycolicibacterium pyrenivorans TaxID=187102 RepID=UPI0021F37EBB|nr:alpha/beta hydrolase [Mycolicibacterium pyrenivorans]MCV7151044.1 alpha/beta fold hydrolase [Mycolicibacterium pyrenivorans]
MPLANPRRVRLSGGTELAVEIAGNSAQPTVLLLHGFPSSARTFRNIIPVLSETAHVIAPDLPGFGRSDVLPHVSFSAIADAISELLERLSVGPRCIYLHDFGAPVGLDIAMNAPDLVSGLIVQNANAHSTGLGPQWSDTFDYWADPNPGNEAAATAHLTFEGTRDQYIAGLPTEVAARIDPEVWAEDWRVMCLPGRMNTQHALIADYAHHVARFDRIADYLSARQPSALMLWGRHDAYFEIAETLSWMRALPRMEAHIFDAGHFLLETHAAQAARLIAEFMARHAN